MRDETYGREWHVANHLLYSSAFRKTGRVLKLKNEHDQWIDGWTVEFVGNTVVDAADAPDYRKAIRRHRKSTGDSQRRLK